MKHWGNKREECLNGNQHSWLKAENCKITFYLCKKCNAFNMVVHKEKINNEK